MTLSCCMPKHMGREFQLEESSNDPSLSVYRHAPLISNVYDGKRSEGTPQVEASVCQMRWLLLVPKIPRAGSTGVTSKPSKMAWSLWLSTDFSTWVVTAPAQPKIMADGPDGPNGADGLGLGFFLGTRDKVGGRHKPNPSQFMKLWECTATCRLRQSSSMLYHVMLTVHVTLSILTTEVLQSADGNAQQRPQPDLVRLSNLPRLSVAMQAERGMF